MAQSQDNYKQTKRDKVLTNMYRDFNFNGNPVLVFKDGDDVAWFLAKQVCDILGLKNSRKAIAELDSDEKNSVTISDGTPGNPNKTIITESGLYMLIMRSRKPEAHEFQRWVTHEVLPQIRRTGGYIPKAETPEETMARAVLIARQTIAEQKQQLEAQKPKVLFADAVSASDGTCLVGELAKMITQSYKDHDDPRTIGQNRLFNRLREDGYLGTVGQNRNVPQQRYVEQGLFRIKETTIVHSDGHTTLNRTTKVTGKGQTYFLNRYGWKEAE